MMFRDEFEFLSNFYPCDVKGYPSVEHFYQAMKSLNPKERIRIKRCETPGRAKRMGRKVTLRPDWDEQKLHVMRFALKCKFEDQELMKKLQAVKGDIVEENNWGDTFWGVCDGYGHNYLGKLLMEVRDL